ncbi:MAG: translocation/assembly module TamB domain-containing protein, partial [Candidatus Marinimicrobia bacterium]|nr:translocation/assembly module TamB domain-containing protein [Candidatus Neomarinimicrobiota bacterium]
SSPPMRVFASEGNTRMGGELFVTEGFFNYWASVFVLDEGSLILDQFENNHQLNFIARKSITTNDNEKVDIIASIFGELNNPEITFTDENNTMSQADIVENLTIGEIRNVIGGVTDDDSDPTSLLSLVEVPLEQQAKKLAGAGGLDRIDIKGGTEGTYIDETTALVIGGRIGRNFYLTYEGSQDDPWNMEFEYRLNNKVSIVGSADKSSVSGAVRLRLQY